VEKYVRHDQVQLVVVREVAHHAVRRAGGFVRLRCDTDDGRVVRSWKPETTPKRDPGEKEAREVRTVTT
jgi:hypothetical protein|tara:strand:- start:243 stop:449 length:207 start_codon:yes stop_codon:yes gene_type:complete